MTYMMKRENNLCILKDRTKCHNDGLSVLSRALIFVITVFRVVATKDFAETPQQRLQIGSKYSLAFQ